MTQLGARTVVGAGCAASVADGKALLEFAAAAGSGGALRHLAALALSGFDSAAAWRRGVELVVAAANAGDTRSQAELDVLIGGDGAWSRADALAAAQAGAAAMHAPPADTTLSSRPLVMQLDAVISPALCAWLREWCEPALMPAGTIDRTSGEFRMEAARTNRFTRIGLFDQPLELHLLKLRLADLVGQPVENFEGTNLLAYEPGEEFAVHHDYLDPSEPGFAAELAERGQRVATVLVALNADYSGGETAFPETGLAWRGRPGDALYFRNVQDNGTPDTLTLHAGRSPADGRKWLLSQWIRDRAQAPG